MSVCVDYFFNYPQDLSTLTREVNDWVGCSLSPYEGNPENLFCRFLGMELSLRRHTLGNDRELNFEDFTYQLGIRAPAPDVDLCDIQIPAVALIAYALHRRLKITGMLVYDVHTLLARYEERLHAESGRAELFDVVSGEFVIMADHLNALDSRLTA